MEICRSLASIPASLVKPIVTLGNFDGVHQGHREIFRRVCREAVSVGGTSVVVTFTPHPLKVVPNLRQVSLITTYEEKEQLIAAAGIDLLIVIPFDQTVASLPPRDFIHSVLVDRIGIHTLFIGYDYAFGHNREGRVPMLVSAGREHGFTVKVMEPINNGSEIYSSSAIRRLILAGDVAGAAPLLGRHFSLAGKVVHGHARGTALGFPTANILSDKELYPADGVYAVKVRLNGRFYDGACNVGRNPTFGNRETSIEVNIFDFSGDIYGSVVDIYFLARIRGERKFTGSEALREAISSDVSRCRELLAETELLTAEAVLPGPTP